MFALPLSGWVMSSAANFPVNVFGIVTLPNLVSPDEGLKNAAKAAHFSLPNLLHMDVEFFQSKIWPHMFYTPAEQIWRWHMNAARSMGNSLDAAYVPDLIRALQENEDERVRGMCAWALGRIGGDEARAALEGFLPRSEGRLRDEVEQALEALKS
jgi:epoxyqueuosine reductase